MSIGKNTEGFALLEVLITVFVVAIGLLGVASLQVVGLREGYNAYLTTQATLLASDLADRIKLNRAGAANGGYILTEDRPVDASAKDCADSTVSCTSAELASHDLYDWYHEDVPGSVQALLPVSMATVDCEFNCAVNRPYTITIRWDAGRDGVLDDDDPILSYSATP